MTDLAPLPLLLVAFFIFRLWPAWPQRHRGCDAYYFLLCAAAFRARPRLPITLPPLYLLEPEEQWYPPLFPVLLATLPEKLLKERYWAVAHGLDAAVAVAIYLVASATIGPLWGSLAFLAYATEANLVAEYQSLTSRPLAAILQLAFLITVYLAIGWSPAWLIAAVVAGAALFYCHKLAMQLIWFVAPILSLVRGEPEWLLGLVGSYLLAFAGRRSLFMKVARAHWDIVAFWSRNWPWLGAHQIRQSPIYGSENATAEEFHNGHGLPLLLSHLRRLVLQNVWIGMLVPAVIFWNEIGETAQLMATIVVAIYTWAMATLAIPWLRCLGEGTKYVKFAEPPLLVLTASLAATLHPVALSIAAVCFSGHAYHYVRQFRTLRQPGTSMAVMSPTLQTLIEQLRADPNARVLCVPPHLADLVAYVAMRPVLWGTHGYGFSEVEPFFPVLRRKLEDLIADYRLTHLLLDERYCRLAELRLSGVDTLASSGEYRLVRLPFHGTEHKAA